MELSWNCRGTGRELERFYYFASFMPAWVPNYYVQSSGRNCGIVLAESILCLTVPVREFEMQNIKKPCITIVGLHHLVTQLLPISCRYMYANFASVVGGAICTILA